MKNEKLSFEEALQALEALVKELENKDLPLEEAVKKYQEGQQLSEICYAKLKQNEALIVTKMTDSGEEPYTPDK